MSKQGDYGRRARRWRSVPALVFHAHLDPLRAVDLLRSPGRGALSAGTGPPVENARRRVAQALAAVGGLGSPAGACLWHIIGLEQSLKEWALQRGWSGRFVAQESATGIPIAALGAVEGYWRGGSLSRCVGTDVP